MLMFVRPNGISFIHFRGGRRCLIISDFVCFVLEGVEREGGGGVGGLRCRPFHLVKVAVACCLFGGLLLPLKNQNWEGAGRGGAADS